MSHYEERLENDLSALRGRIEAMAAQVHKAVTNAVNALQKGDHELAANTILADHPINRTMREIDAACHAFIAVHLPSGRHLRTLSSIIRANIGLERIGDYAVTIACASEQLSSPPEGHMAQELARFGGEVDRMLGQAIRAFNDLNAELAKETMMLETSMEFDLDGIYAELMANPEHANAKSLITTFTVFTHLKRAADQAKNLCEEAVFAAIGETKSPKVYNIVFVDRNNGSISQMAEAIARKMFPGSGNYSSAGANPAAAPEPATVEFLASVGLDIQSAQTRAIDYSEHELAEFHLVVSVQGPVSGYLPSLPFHTTGIEWNVGADELQEGQALEPEQLKNIYRELSSQIGELMLLLRGADAP